MIEYDPKDAVNVWEAGDYDAQLTKVESKTSKSSGKPMDVWTIEAYHPGGPSQLITEYVTAAAAFKIKQLAIALGRKSEFEAGTFQAEDHIGAGFKVALTIEESDQFGDKNKIGRFKPADASAPTPPVQRQQGRQNVQQQNTAPVARRDPRNEQRERVAAGGPAPFSDEQQFKDQDIPF